MIHLPTHFLYRAATRNTITAGDLVCCLCGCTMAAAVPVEKVIRDTFTDHGMLRVPGSTDVCKACDHYFNHRWEAGQKYEAEYRKKSLLVTERKVEEWPRERMLKDLERWLHKGCPGGVFVIGLSKKKHLLPLATVNRPGSKSFVVQLETDPVDLGESFWPLASAFSCLIGLGARKGEILSGNYHHQTLKKIHPKAILDLDLIIRPRRPSPVLTLISYITITEEPAENVGSAPSKSR